MQNDMREQLLSDSLVTYSEKGLFSNVSMYAIVQRFQSMKTRLK